MWDCIVLENHLNCEAETHWVHGKVYIAWFTFDCCWMHPKIDGIQTYTHTHTYKQIHKKQRKQHTACAVIYMMLVLIFMWCFHFCFNLNVHAFTIFFFSRNRRHRCHTHWFRIVHLYLLKGCHMTTLCCWCHSVWHRNF